MKPPDYVELHCHTNFSLRDGASHPHELAKRAKELGMKALAVTDHDGLYGIVRFWKACQAEGIRPIFGLELSLTPGPSPTLAWSVERGAWSEPPTADPSPEPGSKPEPGSSPDAALLGGRGEGSLLPLFPNIGRRSGWRREAGD